MDAGTGLAVGVVGDGVGSGGCTGAEMEVDVGLGAGVAGAGVGGGAVGGEVADGVGVGGGGLAANVGDGVGGSELASVVAVGDGELKDGVGVKSTAESAIVFSLSKRMRYVLWIAWQLLANSTLTVSKCVDG